MKKYSLTKQPRNQEEREKKRRGERWTGTWYVRWKTAEGYTPLKSTGYQSKKDAIDWCDSQVDAPAPSTNVTLGDYAAGFFAWPDGRYAMDRRAGGHRVSYRSSQSNRLNTDLHVLRILGQATPLAAITRRETRKLRDQLFQEGKAPSTINHIVNALSLLLQAAEEDDLIPAVPRVYRAGGAGSPRGVLSRDEALQLFRDGIWPDDRIKIVNHLAAVTGLRQSEILGLTRSNVHRDHLDICQIWERNEYLLKPSTKSGSSRIVPISKRIRRELAQVIAASPHRLPREQRLVFWSHLPHVPLDGRAVTRGLYSALESIGMSEEVRKENRITFHSWRHFANSLLVDAGVPEITVRAMIGHESRGMTLNYYHAQDLARIVAVQDW